MKDENKKLQLICAERALHDALNWIQSCPEFFDPARHAALIAQIERVLETADIQNTIRASTRKAAN